MALRNTNRRRVLLGGAIVAVAAVGAGLGRWLSAEENGGATTALRSIPRGRCSVAPCQPPFRSPSHSTASFDTASIQRPSSMSMTITSASSLSGAATLSCSG
jgi:hypothetical protein